MARGFGKIKGLGNKIKDQITPKRGKGEKIEDEVTTPSSSPAPTANVLNPPQEVAATPENAAPEAAPGNTDADEVLHDILEDLNIKDMVAVVAEKSDTVSEYSGGSAKSVESGDSDDDEDDDDDDDDDETDEEETQAEEEEASGSKKKKKKMGDRFSAVLAAADEIRKKRAGTPESEVTKGSTEATPLTEPGSNANPPAEEGMEVSMSVTQEKTETSKSTKKSKSSKVNSRSSSKSPPNGRKSPIKSKTGGRKSPAKSTDGLPPKPQSSRRIKRSNTPEFSPEFTSKPSAKSSSDDYDDQTKGTMDTGSYDENTFGSGTLGTDGMSYEENRCESGEESLTLDRSQDEMRDTKRTVMNKDVIIHQPGGPNGLVVRAMYYTPLPASPEDIIIKVEASTVSFRDCLLRRGIGSDKASFPFVPGCEVIGTITNAGKDARMEGYRVGDRVVGMTRRGGGNGYYAKLNTSTVAPVLATRIDAADAVCLVDVYMTAYQALRVGKKDGTPLTEANVLITDGFSPVGQAAVQLAKLEGANVFVTTSDGRQDEYMKSLGVKCLPLAPSKWLYKLKGKMDVVIDNTCFDNYESSWKALSPTGMLVCTGMTSIYSIQDYASGAVGGGCCDAFGDIRDFQAKWAALKAKYIMRQTKIHDLWESFQTDPKKYQQELKYLCFLVENGTLKPKIAERVSIEEVPDAQRYLETGKVNGTIVCLP